MNTEDLLLKKLYLKDEFRLESGYVLKDFTIAYHTYGTLNETRDNVIWITHALTGSSDVSDWWKDLFGESKILNPEKYFIICANVIGSCYGSTGPVDTNPETGAPYYQHFPEVTVRDMVKAHDILRKNLGISKIHLLMGGSLGGQQVLEWAILQPELIKNICVLASNAKHSPWGIAFNATQRMAIETDPTWNQMTPEAGVDGLETARAIAMLSYRHYDTYFYTQQDENDDIYKPSFKAESYQRYQGNKLRKRFNALSYWYLSKAMDSHNVGRNREGIESALRNIRSNALVIGISSDILFPPREQKFIATYIPGAKYIEIDSIYGHDGFLVETEKINNEIIAFLENINN